jgi:outer membrane protein OmpA-like peptidoglycan-associated protein
MKQTFFKTNIITALISVAILFSAGSIEAQINLKDKLKNKVNQRANQKVDKGIDKGLDAVENGAKSATTTEKNTGNQQTQTKQQPTDNKPSFGNKGTANTNTNSEESTGTSQQDPVFQSFSKYDFVPGERVILYEDFSQDAVGDFPALWTTNAPGEVNTISIASGHWLNLNSGDGNYFLLKSIDFPKNFIIEFDIVPKAIGGRLAATLILYGETKPMEMDNNPRPGNGGIQISLEKQNWNTFGYKTSESAGITGTSQINPVVPEKVNHVIFWFQNRRVRIYHKSAKVLDMPTNMYDGTKLNRLCFRLNRGISAGSYISNVRITDAAPDMRSKLLTEGKLVSYGIYFDVNKDVVKPESYGSLKGIADVLSENSAVRIKVIGHTDGDGDAAANLDLSKRRAVSVKNELVKSFNIDGSRIETDGKGETLPVAGNDTPANKAQNRRVEFIKL